MLFLFFIIPMIQNSSVSESLIPEEYRMVKNKGLQSLEFYEECVCFIYPEFLVLKLFDLSIFAKI